MKRFCKSNLLVLFLVILLTVLIVYIALNSYNKEMFTNLSLNDTNDEGNLLFYSNLLGAKLQRKVDHIINKQSNSSSEDNGLLSGRHLKQVYETRRPELITKSPNSPEQLCYLNLQEL